VLAVSQLITDLQRQQSGSARFLFPPPPLQARRWHGHPLRESRGFLFMPLDFGFAVRRYLNALNSAADR